MWARPSDAVLTDEEAAAIDRAVWEGPPLTDTQLDEIAQTFAVLDANERRDTELRAIEEARARTRPPPDTDRQ